LFLNEYCGSSGAFCFSDNLSQLRTGCFSAVEFDRPLMELVSRSKISECRVVNEECFTGTWSKLLGNFFIKLLQTFFQKIKVFLIVILAFRINSGKICQYVLCNDDGILR